MFFANLPNTGSATRFLIYVGLFAFQNRIPINLSYSCVNLLIDKIKSSASHRLALPAGRLPAEELGRYRAFLKVERTG